jgi:hypothetical protein
MVSTLLDVDYEILDFAVVLAWFQANYAANKPKRRLIVLGAYVHLPKSRQHVARRPSEASVTYDVTAVNTLLISWYL